MTEKEIEIFKAEIKAEVIKELTGKAPRSGNAERGPLAEVRRRYAKCGGPLYEKFGTVTYNQVWVTINQLAKHLVNERYVRNLTLSKEIEYAGICDFLCRYVTGEIENILKLQPLEEWHEDIGDCLWWKLPIDEQPYFGTPLTSDWPGYHTHFQRVPMPIENYIEPEDWKWNGINFGR